MDSSQMKLQNTEAYVGLVGSHSIAQPGDTSKYFQCTTGSESERVYVDGCTSDASSVFSVGNLQSYVQHAVKGGTSALFLSGCGITRMGDYDRRQFMNELCGAINASMAQYDPDLSMTYAFVGVTDSKVVDFHRDRTIGGDRLANGLGDLQHEVDDWEVVEEKILRGATLPFVLSLHFESLRGPPTNGHLCVVDMNVVNWSPAGAVSDSTGVQSMLQQSAASLGNLIHLLANDAILTGVTVPTNALTSLVGEFLYGESKTAFVFFLNTDEAAAHDLPPAVDLIKSVRKLKSRDLVRVVDRRVMFFLEKAKYYQGEKYRLQDELADLQEEKEQVEKDLDDIQRDFGDEREALGREVEHWQQKSNELETTLESLKAESEGMEADARWENARLVTEKLALKDELRRSEIEMTTAEESKSKLLDLYEGLQTSYDSLDTVYAELLAAYRLLKDRFGQLADERTNLLQRTGELESQAVEHVQLIAKLRSDIAQLAEDRDQRIEDLESRQAQEIEQIEAKLAAESQRVREFQARVANLETANKALATSQNEEVAELQSTVTELSAQLEDAKRRASAEQSSAAAALRAAEKQAKRLDAEKTKLQAKLDDAVANTDEQAEAAEREAQWARERDQLQRQIRRLQQTAESSQRREAELRDESERQWSVWEDEKLRNHEKYLALKSKFRQAVEFAADVQVRLDSERDHASEPSANPVLATDSVPEPVVAKKPEAAKKPNGRTRARKPPAKRTSPPKTASHADSDESDAEPTPALAPAPALAPRRRPVNYAEPEISDDNSVPEPPAPADEAAPVGGMARAEASDSDDSEISFNPRAIAPKKRRAVRPRKSAAELNAKLTPRPARKRPGAARKPAAADNSPSPPKRKRAAAERPSKARAAGSKNANIAQPQPPAEIELVASTDVASATTALKKKRKLNLSRMRNLLGIGADRPPSADTSTQAVKFVVPRIRSAATDAPDAAADSD
ncbi:hypothetical protein H4S02_002409 [Coemansia sp. RSA 2611]|nr:hypothetical protein H4S02_002409 [Coemansia sp. RSA 2611]